MSDQGTKSVIKAASSSLLGRREFLAGLLALGAGAFPTVGTANPTLTIAALSLRVVGTIQRDLRG